MAFIYFTQCTEALMHILKVDKGHSSKYHSLHKNAASHSYTYIHKSAAVAANSNTKLTLLGLLININCLYAKQCRIIMAHAY